MADTHGQTPDPNAAPMHHEIKESFSTVDVTICIVLGLVAIAAGIISGLLFIND